MVTYCQVAVCSQPKVAPIRSLYCYYHKIKGNDIVTGDALDAVDRCVHEDPELPDVYTVQSRIAKHAGDLEAAVAAACKAESLDLADR